MEPQLIEKGAAPHCMHLRSSTFHSEGFAGFAIALQFIFLPLRGSIEQPYATAFKRPELHLSDPLCMLARYKGEPFPFSPSLPAQPLDTAASLKTNFRKKRPGSQRQAG